MQALLTGATDLVRLSTRKARVRRLVAPKSEVAGRPRRAGAADGRVRTTNDTVTARIATPRVVLAGRVLFRVSEPATPVFTHRNGAVVGVAAAKREVARVGVSTGVRIRAALGIRRVPVRRYSPVVPDSPIVRAGVILRLVAADTRRIGHPVVLARLASLAGARTNAGDGLARRTSRGSVRCAARSAAGARASEQNHTQDTRQHNPNCTHGTFDLSNAESV